MKQPRTGFELIDGEPVRRIYDDVPFAVEFTQAKEEQAEALVHGFVRAFDLEKAPANAGRTDRACKRPPFLAV
nr:hypothetical protein P5644_10120 [Bacillus velezensis]